MSLRLLAGEPEAGPWQAERLTVVADGLMRLGQRRSAARRPVVLAIDGRSSGGKTTLAGRLQAAVEGSAVVHTDDIPPGRKIMRTNDEASCRTAVSSAPLADGGTAYDPWI
jgi:hypothetical protein